MPGIAPTMPWVKTVNTAWLDIWLAIATANKRKAQVRHFIASTSVGHKADGGTDRHEKTPPRLDGGIVWESDARSQRRR